MDIRRWLEETKTPGSPASLGLPAGQHARERAARDAGKRSSHHSRKRKRLQKHTSSDSSLLRLDRANGFHQPVTRKAGNEDRARQHTASDKLASRCSSELSGSADRSESELYTRRPRGRTHPEIYEPKADKRRTREDHGRKKKGIAPTKQKERRRTKHRQPDPAHAFHAKNVAKDRLTLKPKEGLGLFKKGRASSPVRGRGLPDLVFSEMSFLQKRSDLKDNQSAEEARSKRRKNGKNAGQEEEISAYFASKRPALAEKDGNIPSKKRSEHLSRSKMCKSRQASPSANNPTSTGPPVELPNKPYLGFGTRGADPTSCADLITSSDTSHHIPWSESVRHTTAAASQRSSEHPMLPQVEGVGQRDSRDYTSDVSKRAVHGRMWQDTSENVPLDSARRHHGGAENDTASCDAATFRQLQVKNDIHFRTYSSQIKIPVPPSSHKHRATEDRQESPRPAPRQPRVQIEKNTTKTDVNEQQERRTNQTKKGNRSQRSSAGGPNVCGTQNRNVKMGQDAIEGTTDATKGRAPQRSSSPLSRLLRQCDDACHDPPPAHSAPAWRQSSTVDMGHLEKSVEIDRAAGQEEAHRPSVPRRWAGNIAPNHPGFYQMQVPDAATFDDHDDGCAAVGEMLVPDMEGDAINDGEFEYLEELEGLYVPRDRSERDFDVGYDMAGDSYGGRAYGIIGRNGGQQEREKEGSAETLAGFWRPHKLY